LPNIWITYAWRDNADGSFDYLVDALQRGGVSARYDKIQLIPGKRLWEQIGERIMAAELNGWAYLLTPNSIASQPCMEELAYALDRALQRGSDFPLIGLLHQVPLRDVPLPLKVRLCVDLRASDWVDQVKAGLENRAPSRVAQSSFPFISVVHENYLGVPGQTALEIRPHLGEHPFWRIAYPASHQATAVGCGPAGGRGLSGTSFNVIEGTVRLNGLDFKYYGQGDTLTPAVSAYIAFSGGLPSPLYIGFARQTFVIPEQWLLIRVNGM